MFLDQPMNSCIRFKYNFYDKSLQINIQINIFLKRKNNCMALFFHLLIKKLTIYFALLLKLSQFLDFGVIKTIDLSNFLLYFFDAVITFKVSIFLIN